MARGTGYHQRKGQVKDKEKCWVNKTSANCVQGQKQTGLSQSILILVRFQPPPPLPFPLPFFFFFFGSGQPHLRSISHSLSWPSATVKGSSREFLANVAVAGKQWQRQKRQVRGVEEVSLHVRGALGVPMSFRWLTRNATLWFSLARILHKATPTSVKGLLQSDGECIAEELINGIRGAEVKRLQGLVL